MKVLLIDDHDLFVDGMHLVLARLDAKIQIFDANSCDEALPLIQDNPDIDLLLLDLGLPDITDVDALKLLRNRLPAAPVVVLSGNDDACKVHQMLNLGAQGYIPKSTRSDLLISALNLVLSGGIYIPSVVLSQETGDLKKTQDNKIDKADIPLTSRQFDVLHELIHGKSNKEIGKILNLAEATVRVHMAAIFKALNVSNRTRAVNVAIQKGWVEFEH